MSLTIGATIFGVILSTLHQSSLGALFLIAPTKLHPLWYSPFIPLFFFVSSVVAGLSMVIFEGMLSHRVFADQVEISHEQFDRITLGLGKAAAVVLAIYFRDQGHRHRPRRPLGSPRHAARASGSWSSSSASCCCPASSTPWPSGSEGRRWSAGPSLLTVVGIVLNRLNVSMIAFNWQLPAEQRYVPHWMEIWVSATLVTTLILIFRWTVRRMPVLREHPDFKGAH